MFRIDPRDPTPVHAQLEREVRAAVADAVLGPGDALPTVRQLAVELKVNANAVSRAYEALEEQGVLDLTGGHAVVRRVAEGGPDREARLARLAALEDAFLAQAASLGFSLDEIIIHLDGRRKPAR